jgi:hypothetical protein
MISKRLYNSIHDSNYPYRSFADCYVTKVYRGSLSSPAYAERKQVLIPDQDGLWNWQRRPPSED